MLKNTSKTRMTWENLGDFNNNQIRSKTSVRLYNDFFRNWDYLCFSCGYYSNYDFHTENMDRYSSWYDVKLFHLVTSLAI